MRPGTLLCLCRSYSAEIDRIRDQKQQPDSPKATCRTEHSLGCAIPLMMQLYYQLGLASYSHPMHLELPCIYQVPLVTYHCPEHYLRPSQHTLVCDLSYQVHSRQVSLQPTWQIVWLTVSCHLACEHRDAS